MGFLRGGGSVPDLLRAAGLGWVLCGLMDQWLLRPNGSKGDLKAGTGHDPLSLSDHPKIESYAYFVDAVLEVGEAGE